MTRSRLDLLAGIAASLLGAVMLYATFRLPVPIGVDPMGPKAFPGIIAFAMLLCGGTLVVQALGRRMSASGADGEAPAGAGHPVAVGIVAVGLLLYYIAYTRLGFVVSTAIFLLLFLSFFNRGRHVVNVVIAVAFPLVLNIVFVEVLGASPARGILPF